MHRCDKCGVREYAPASKADVRCVNCGHQLDSAGAASAQTRVVLQAAIGPLWPPWSTSDIDGKRAAWRDECERVAEAYDLWTRSTPIDRDLAYAAYLAAVDREERAARDLLEAVDRLAAAAW